MWLGVQGFGEMLRPTISCAPPHYLMRSAPPNYARVKARTTKAQQSTNLNLDRA